MSEAIAIALLIAKEGIPLGIEIWETITKNIADPVKMKQELLVLNARSLRDRLRDAGQAT